MGTVNRKVIFEIVFVCVFSINIQAQTSALDVVRNWGLYLKQYAETGDIQNRILLDEITPPNCLVNDFVAQKIAKENGFPAGTLRVADYYNAIENWKSLGRYTLHLEFLKYQKNICTPGEMSSLGDTLHVVLGRLDFRGTLTWNDRVMFFVRGKKITKIISVGDGETLGKAIELYSNKDYNAAFHLFRKLANLDMSNYMAQYYTAIMLLKGEGCTYIHPEIRRREAIWWLFRGKVKNQGFLQNEWNKYKEKNGSSISYADYVLQFGEDLSYNHFPEALRLMLNAYNENDIMRNEFPLYKRSDFTALMKTTKPFNAGLMLWLDTKTNRYGYLNEKNEVVIPFKYKVSSVFNKNGLALVYGDDGKKGFINTKGKEVIPCIYDRASDDFIGNTTFVIKDGTLILLTDKNEQIRRISGYKELRTIALDKYMLIQNPQETGYDMFDTMGNIVAYNVDGVNTDINEIWKVRKNGKVIYSCYMNWR